MVGYIYDYINTKKVRAFQNVKASNDLIKPSPYEKGIPTTAYWDDRYKKGGNSGAGSFSYLGDFKAEVVNAFLEKHAIDSVIEWGCGDGTALSLMNYKTYLGLDVSEEAIKICMDKFNESASKSFSVITDGFSPVKGYDMSVSLDVIYHIMEDDTFREYFRKLTMSAKKYICIYSSNFDLPHSDYIRHRSITDYMRTHHKDWYLYEVCENRFPYNGDHLVSSFSDFYFYKRKLLR